MMVLVLVLLTLLTPTDVSSAEPVPLNNQEFGEAGRLVSVSYQFPELSSTDFFLWYRQHPGGPPQFLILHSSSGSVLDRAVPGLEVEVKQTKVLHLLISSAAVTNSAVYYCEAHCDRKSCIFIQKPRPALWKPHTSFLGLQCHHVENQAWNRFRPVLIQRLTWWVLEISRAVWFWVERIKRNTIRTGSPDTDLQGYLEIYRIGELLVSFYAAPSSPSHCRPVSLQTCHVLCHMFLLDKDVWFCFDSWLSTNVLTCPGLCPYSLCWCTPGQLWLHCSSSPPVCEWMNDTL
nr:uncharacterized protein LOC129164290 [Nothobranchius furzeri]